MAALARPQMSPTRVGMNGRGFLRSGANRPSAARRPLRRSSSASRAPMPIGRISFAHMDSDPRPA